LKTYLKRLVALVVTLAGLAFASSYINLAIKIGPVTVIFGNNNKVEIKDESDQVLRPFASVTAEAKPVQVESERVAESLDEEGVEEETSDVSTTSEESHVRRIRRDRQYYNYSSNDECTCPAETQFEPQVQQYVYPTYTPRRAPIVVEPTYIQSQTQSISHVSVQSDGTRITVTTNSANVRVQVNGETILPKRDQ
jgi:hypothetical protein